MMEKIKFTSNKKERIENSFTESEKYKKELLPIIEILKPDGISLDDYEKQLTSELFDDVKRIQTAKGILLEDPDKTIAEAKDLLNSRMKSALSDARNYSLKQKPNPELIKKSKIAMLFEGDMTDAEKSSYMKEDRKPRIDDLRNYILEYGDNHKFTESDIDSLMKTKCKEHLTSIFNHNYYTGSDKAMDKIPQSLMIGLVQAEEESPSNNHYYPLKGGLETAEIGKYDNSCLEQLLASDYTRLCMENFDKFKGKPIEKIFKSGDFHGDQDPLEFIKKLDLSKEDFDKYLDIIVKHNVCYNLRESFGKFNDKNFETVSVYQNIIEKLHDIEMDVHYKNDLQNLLGIKDIIENGYIGLALATPVCRYYIKKYAENDYENFVKDISKYDQEHLVFEYLKDEDKIKYAHKLIDQGEEYQIVKLNKLFKEHSLSAEIFNSINKKNLIYSLKGKLSKFKDLPSKEALGFMERDRTSIFIDNIDSFNFSEEFLKSEKVQKACFAEFNKEIMTFHPEKARIISEKIPFNKEELDQAVLKAVKYKWLEADGGRNDWARAVIYEFPEIKKYLDNKDDKERAFNYLKKQLDNGYAEYVAEILECFPLDRELLESEEIRDLCLRSIEKSSHGFGNNSDFNKDVEKYFKNIGRISRYIKVPEYLLQQKEIIDSIYTNENKELKLIEKECIIKILESQAPSEKYNDILRLIDEVKNFHRISNNNKLLFAYITKFENGGTEEEKHKFISYIEEVTQNVEKNIVVDNWEYLYNNFSNLSQKEMDEHKKLLEKINYSWGSNFLDNGFLKNIKFSKIFDQLNSYSSIQQNEMIDIVKMGMGSSFISERPDENNYTINTLLYINESEGLRRFRRSEEVASQTMEMFKGEYKDVVLKMMSQEWQSFLNSDSKYLPPNIYFISKLIDEAGGAGNLKHLESLGDLIYQINNTLDNPKTVEKTKKEIKTLLSEQEIKFNKEKLSQDDRSEFYNLSNDILKASPSLYSAFYPIFESLSSKDMKIFIKEIFPFYQAQLVVIQEMGDDDEAKYKPRDLVDVRQSLKTIQERIKNPSEDIKSIFDSEKIRLIEVVKSGFKNRFGLMKVPMEFNKENLRSIQNAIRYIGNISGKNMERETIIAFYLGLEINNEWEAFRQGEKIEIGDYFSDKQLDIIKPLIEEKNKSSDLLIKTTGISKEQVSKFQQVLQEDTISNIIGNIKTVDIKLGDIKRSVLELTDPDIYDDQIDKDVILLLTEEGKSIGSVLAKTYAEVSGKTIYMTDDEKLLQSKIASIFGIKSWSVDKVKQIQDKIQPLSLVSSMINKIEKEKVDENIKELQKRLMPTGRIIEIFNRLGEEFKQESGAMALSADLTYLESLMIKDDKKITPEEKEEIGVYINSIKDKMKELEITLDKIREYFDKIKKSSHLDNNGLLKDRLDNIEKIIYSKDSSTMIVSHMTKDLNLIIENMRQCLGCMRKEANNDTNLAFGDYNKFFMMNQGDKEKGSISDEIVFFVPIKTPNGKEEMSFVLDRVYGSKSSDVLIGNILSVYKKYQALKKITPNARISISVSNEALSSVGLTPEILKKRLNEIIKDINYIEEFTELIVDIPKSAFSDNYVEFGNGSARQTGERQFGGLILK